MAVVAATKAIETRPRGEDVRVTSGAPGFDALVQDGLSNRSAAIVKGPAVKGIRA